MRTQTTPKKVTYCTSGRRHTIVDYSQFESTTDFPSLPRKRPNVDTKRKPSKTRIAVEKYKTKPINKPCPVRNHAHTGIPIMMTPIVSTHPTPSSTADTKSDAVPSTSGTQTVTATPEETKNTLNQLLNLGETAEFDDDNENAELVPLVPTASQPQQDIIKQDPNTVMLPCIIGSAIKVETSDNTANKGDTKQETKDVCNCQIQVKMQVPQNH